MELDSHSAAMRLAGVIDCALANGDFDSVPEHMLDLIREAVRNLDLAMGRVSPDE